MRVADPITFITASTPLGVALVAASSRGVCALALGDQESALIADLEASFGGDRCRPADAETSAVVRGWLDTVKEALHAGVDGMPRLLSAPLSVPLDLAGTAFQLAVWRQLQTVPVGQVVTYTELARAIGAPRTVRAVGSACGANRVALLVPCHRAVRQDGQLGGYRWGLERKAQLLAWERTGR
jgi:AraC family transcriptional regulator of adaptative response/methylated-DNA-[protein]-cysteine methyltransferase